MNDTPAHGGKSPSYAWAGVDIDAGNALVDAIKPAVASTVRSGTVAEIGGFGGLFDLKAADYADPILVAANDGVGTKLMLATETGSLATVGIDLVAMCVNDLVVQGAEPLFFLDYFATGRLDVEAARTVVEGIAAGCRLAGCALIGGETAEMPGMYRDGEFDLAGFAVGAVERGSQLPSPQIEQGDILLGLASSGLHSNGFSLVRKIVERSGAGLAAPAPFDSDRELGNCLLDPTRIYVRSLLKALRTGDGIHAMAHVTGGGLTENVPRMLPAHLAANIDLAAWKLPPVFEWLARCGDIPEKEMVRTFNCGIGMVIAVEAVKAGEISGILRDGGEDVVEIGIVEKRSRDAVRFAGRLEP